MSVKRLFAMLMITYNGAAIHPTSHKLELVFARSATSIAALCQFLGQTSLTIAPEPSLELRNRIPCAAHPNILRTIMYAETLMPGDP